VAGRLEVTVVAVDVRRIGGMERQLTALVTGLLERGVAVTLVARTCELPAHPLLRFVRVPVPGRPFALGYPLFLAIATLMVRRHARGVLHATGAIVLGRADVATVHLCHAGAREHDLAPRAQRATLPYRVNAAVVRRLALAMERRTYRPGRVRRLVAVSGGLARELRAAFPAVADRVDVIPNGVDTGRFRPDAEAREAVRAEHGLPDDALVAVFVGGEWSRKGLRFAVEALPHAPAWRLLAVGQGDAEEIAALADRLGVADRVTVRGPRPDPERVFAAADAFVLPTAYETFSLVTYEAAACGLPLLATPVSGIEDILRDGVTGLTIERDGDSVARGLRALEDPARRRAMGAAAREAAGAFGWDAVVDGYVATYRSLAGG
jgi:glycosyltransferase involved in cell wall biosynthesis